MTKLYQRDLRRKMVNIFSTEELETLAFDLRIEWGELPGEINSKKVAAMISHQMRNGELEALIDLLREERPNEEWPENIPEPEQQIEDEKADLSEAELQSIFENLIDKIGPLVFSVAQIKTQVEANLKYLDAPRTGHLVRLLAGANLIGHINLEGVSLRREDLKRANLSFAQMSRADLSETNLDNAQLNTSNLSISNLRKASLIGADFLKADLIEANFSEANLSGANLARAVLLGANLTKAILIRANLSEAKLRRANLEMADLTGANLRRTNLERVYLHRAKLSGTDLTAANVRVANLVGADLREAKLKWANLSGAMLEMADLEGAHLEGAHLSKVKYTNSTIWPDSFDPEGAGAILVDDEGNPIEEKEQET